MSAKSKLNIVDNQVEGCIVEVDPAVAVGSAVISLGR